MPDDDDWLRLNRPARYYGRIWSAERRAERARRAHLMGKATTVYYTAKPPPPETLVDAEKRTATTPRLKARMFVVQDGLCYLCGDVMDIESGRHVVTVDHVVPLSRGGRNAKNRALAGSDCNVRKSNRMPYPCERIYLNMLNLRLGGVKGAAQNPFGSGQARKHVEFMNRIEIAKAERDSMAVYTAIMEMVEARFTPLT